jgi:hypothetical protein
MNGDFQTAVQRKTARVILVAYLADGHEFAGRFALPPTDGARASRP